MALTFCVFPSNQHPLGSSCILSGKEACGKISATCTVLEQSICHRVLGGFRSHLSSAALGKWKLSFLNRIALEDFSGSLPYQGNHSVGLQKAPPGFWNKSTARSGVPSLPHCCLATGLLLETSPVAVWEVAPSPCVSSVTGTPQTQARSLPRGPDSHCMGGLCSVTSEGCGGEAPGSNTSNQNRSETYLRLHLQ